MARARIRCIVKTDRKNLHERIQYVGGINPSGGHWKLDQPEVIQRIESGEWDFYVQEDGKTVDVVVATHNGNKYIKTKPDGIQPDNLLALPTCP